MDFILSVNKYTFLYPCLYIGMYYIFWSEQYPFLIGPTHPQVYKNCYVPYIADVSYSKQHNVDDIASCNIMMMIFTE